MVKIKGFFSYTSNLEIIRLNRDLLYINVYSVFSEIEYIIK